MRPAWSWQFEPEILEEGPDLGLPRSITYEWACGRSTGEGVKVAVVDSGVEADHPLVGQLQGAVALEWDPEVPGSIQSIEGPHQDLFGHGTACASIIRGLAPDCELYSVRVLGERLTGRGQVFAAGIRWAIEHGMDVVNLSLSTGSRIHFGRFHELVDEAYFNKIMLVCAISNTAGPSYPSEFSGVFSVAATDGSLFFSHAFNPHGPAEWGAPGINLGVAWSGGGTVRATGNSFAAPHIAGLIALIISKHPGLTPFQVKTILAELASNAPSQNLGPDAMG